MNSKLLDFLAKPATIQKLIDYFTQPLPAEADEKMLEKYPVTAAEIFACDALLIQVALFANLDHLFSAVFNSPLTPIQYGCFGKTVLSVIEKPEILRYLMSREHVVRGMVERIEVPAMEQILWRLVEFTVGLDEASPYDSAYWGSAAFLMQLVSQLDNLNPDAVANAARLLLDIIAKFQSNQNIPFGQFFNVEFYSIVLSAACKQPEVTMDVPMPPYQVVFKYDARPALSLLGALIPNLSPEAPDAPQIVALLQERVAYFHEQLVTPPATLITTSMGPIVPPFGTRRLSIVDFLQSVFSSRLHDLQQSFAEAGTLCALWDLFFQYEWNNILHHVTVNIYAAILEGSNEQLQRELFTRCNIVARILRAIADNETKRAQDPKRRRKGWMGHVLLLANATVEGANICPFLSEYLTSPAWINMTTGFLKKMNKLEDMKIGGDRPPSARVDYSSGSDQSPTDLDDDSGGMKWTLSPSQVSHSPLASSSDDFNPFSEEDDFPPPPPPPAQRPTLSREPTPIHFPLGARPVSEPHHDSDAPTHSSVSVSPPSDPTPLHPPPAVDLPPPPPPPSAAAADVNNNQHNHSATADPHPAVDPNPHLTAEDATSHPVFAAAAHPIDPALASVPTPAPVPTHSSVDDASSLSSSTAAAAAAPPASSQPPPQTMDLNAISSSSSSPAVATAATAAAEPSATILPLPAPSSSSSPVPTGTGTAAAVAPSVADDHAAAASSTSSSSSSS
eukprot:gnl/Spiro4/21722_TR10639_c0_g1_i1.p1 gnl/Spiro4/21722_TR10639_c0_g1~~gnl/Spiro4/21722_TR10639_c0_g1_i1.p1  ORF type:complete len:806 (-),score=242.11 gnl/Spiro4/21722_TR10639_c0_g1_i1:163-2361(-)